MKIRRHSIGFLVLAGLGFAASAQGYYHFVHYTTATSGYQQIPEKFDLSALVNNTVIYVIDQKGPDTFGPGDTLTALASQIHFAARTWNAVPTSQLRLAFGGFVPAGAPASSIEIEYLFDDLPPGVLGYGAPVVRGNLTGTDAARFVPIQKSTVILPRDMSSQPSWSENLFLTLVHETGHALGLQHSQAGSVMSTQVGTRATTKAAPITADDRAGLSTLYPTPDFAARFGSITGQVTSGADGINLASVVALTADGDALMTLTNPDGTYEIDGVPAGDYLLYTHPLPPPVGVQSYPDDIRPPTDLLTNSLLPYSGPFISQFFPGVQRIDSASVVVVKPGVTASQNNFQVTRSASIPVYDVQTYSFPGQVAVRPAHLSPATGYRNLMVLTGVGMLTASGAPTAGLTSEIIGPTVSITDLRPYAPSTSFLQVDTQLYPIPGTGPRHMIVRSNGVAHLVPSAIRVVAQSAPVITDMAAVQDAAGNPYWELHGSGFSPASSVYFDGVAVPVVPVSDTVMRVTPPPAPSGYRAAIVILNPDGQSTLFLAAQPALYAYGNVADAGISVTPATLTPGVETMVEIDGSGTAFTPGTILSFGSADIQLQRLWATGPQRIIANVIAMPGAQAGALPVMTLDGLRALTLPQGIQVAAAPTSPAPSVASAIVDDATGRPAISPGFNAHVQLTGIDPNLKTASFVVTVAGIAAAPVSFTNSVLVFTVPAGLAPGPATVQITAGAAIVPTVLLAVDLPPPVITSVSSGTTAAPASAGDIVTIHVNGLLDSQQTVDPSRLVVTVGGIASSIVQSTVSSPGPGNDISFQVPAKLTSGNNPVIISIDLRPSAPFNLVVH